MITNEIEMWAVFETSPTFYIAQLIVTDREGATHTTGTFLDAPSSTLNGIRKALKAKGLEPLARVDESGVGAIEFWV